MPNRLISESSPYLLQHANNPVDWFPWGNEALEKAKSEDKPIILSIGYAACHWCHVMEHECFENQALAELMNKYFVCIKVDREERPDIDQIYMDAVQNMGIRGGWPLNVFLNSSSEPFYGGTYFPASNWRKLLEQIHLAYQEHRGQIDESAKGFVNSLNRSEFEKYNLGRSNSVFSIDDYNLICQKISANFDAEWGGMNKVPKFPMPSNYFLLLRIWEATHNQKALDHAIFTLKKMALGGIYDQIGGGFARYSTDGEWFLPHFEKMLYDNAQLISLYTEAYKVSRDELFKEVVYATIEFIKTELTSPTGGFYSALDADSEGEEGKFYVWDKIRIVQLLGNEAPLFCEYFQVTDEGNWENGNNILWANTTKEDFAKTKHLDLNQLKQSIQKSSQILMAERATRIRPGLDDKVLTSWNGLMLNGLVDAYRTFNEPLFLQLALDNANFVIKHLVRSSEDKRMSLYHSFKNGKSTISGFLEDYAFMIQAFINLYQATFDEKWLFYANELMITTLDEFYDETESLFFFTSTSSEKLIARKKEIFDNVIPSSNSVMALNCYFLGKLFYENSYIQLSEKMLKTIFPLLVSEPNYMSNWGVLMRYFLSPTKEIVIVGEQCLTLRFEIDQNYYPNKVFSGAFQSSELPILKNKQSLGGETTIYMCENQTCSSPTTNVSDVVSKLIF